MLSGCYAGMWDLVITGMMLIFSWREGQLGKTLAQPQSNGNSRLTLQITERKENLAW